MEIWFLYFWVVNTWNRLPNWVGMKVHRHGCVANFERQQSLCTWSYVERTASITFPTSCFIQ